MSYEEIVYEKLGRVGRITLNRPDQYNAQSRSMRDEMDEAFAEAVADDEVRVIILAGAGRNFSTGHDVGRELVEHYKANPPTPEGRTLTSWRYNVENSLRWRDVPKPTIAAVQGYCIFGGWIIAAAMDLVVASEDALFLPGYVQYFSAPWDLGIRKAREVLFKSRFLTAEEACEAGFVNKVVPRDELEQATLDFAEEIAESDPLVLRMTKLAINNAQDAMGYRASVESAHAGHIVLALAGKMTPLDGKHRLPGVDQAVTKLRRAQGKNEVAASATTAEVVDACVFHEWTGVPTLAPYLSENGRALLMRQGDVGGPVRVRGPFLYEDPRGAKEPESYPPDGPPGSSFELLAEQILGSGDRDRVVLGYDESLLFTLFHNHWVQREVARAANDWTVAEWLGRDERLFGMLCVATGLPEEAAAEVRRAGANPRMVAVALGGNTLARPFGHAAYHPIYEAATELGLPVVIQIGSDNGSDMITPPVAGGLPATYGEYKVLANHSHMAHATSMISNGVFDRFPTLKVLLVGGGIGWIPSHLWRLDYWFKEVRHETPWLTRMPSEYFLEHFSVTTDDLDAPPAADGLATLLSTMPGFERCLTYASCYPNRGYEAPGRTADRLPESWRDGVLGANALELFRWPSATARAGAPEPTARMEA